MKEERRYCVYVHTCPDGKVYVGMTSTSLKKRSKNGLGYQTQYFFEAVKKHGWENIKHEILYEDLPKCEAELKEQEVINLYKANDPAYGYNLENGGSKGKTTDAIREKLRLSHPGLCGESNPNYGKDFTGENNPFYGRKHSAESRLKISQNHADVSGKNNPNYGKPLSEAQRKRLSEYMKGRCAGGKNPRAKKVLCIETGQVFGCISDAAKWLKSDRHDIVACCSGKKEAHKGYHFRFLEDKTNEN